MFKKRNIILLILAISIALFAYEKTFGGELSDRVNSVNKTDKNVILVGTTESFGNGQTWIPDAYILCLDFKGNLIWEKVIGSPETDESYACYDYNRKYLYIVGIEFNNKDGNANLIKMDYNGDVIYKKQYGGKYGDVFYDIIGTKDGNLLLLGSTQSFGAGKLEDLYLVKCNLDGDTIWTRKYGIGNHMERGKSCIELPDNCYIIVGTKWFVSLGNEDIWVLKVDEKGDLLWSKTIGDEFNDNVNSIIHDNIDNFTMAGYYSPDSLNMAAWIVHFSFEGKINWSKKYMIDGNTTMASDIIQLSDGGYYVTGTVGSFQEGWSDIFLLKLDSNGDSLWSKKYGGEGLEFGVSIERINRNRYILTGDTESYGSGEFDIFMLEVDSLGKIIKSDNDE